MQCFVEGSTDASLHVEGAEPHEQTSFACGCRNRGMQVTPLQKMCIAVTCNSLFATSRGTTEPSQQETYRCQHETDCHESRKAASAKSSLCVRDGKQEVSG